MNKTCKNCKYTEILNDDSLYVENEGPTPTRCVDYWCFKKKHICHGWDSCNDFEKKI